MELRGKGIDMKVEGMKHTYRINIIQPTKEERIEWNQRELSKTIVELYAYLDVLEDRKNSAKRKANTKKRVLNRVELTIDELNILKKALTCDCADKKKPAPKKKGAK